MANLAMITVVTASCQFKNSSEKNQEMTEKPSYPKSTGYDVPYLQANFWRLTYNSASPELAYRIVVPKSMRPTNMKPTPLPNIGFTLIGEYQIIDKSVPYMEVQVAYEKVSEKYPDLNTWFKDKLEKLKGTVVEESPITIGANQGYDILYTRTLKKSGEQIVNRATMIKNGDNYIVVSAMCSKEDYEKNAKTIYHILTNWDMQ